MNSQLLLLINGWAGHNALLDALMVFCARYLIYVVFAAAAVCFVLLVLKKEWRAALYYAGTLIVSFILLQIAARLYVDHRPFVDYHVHQLVAHASGKSFPSDHTTATAAIGLGLLLFTRFKKTGALIVLAALVIGFARVFVGIHYPIDIAGGLLTALVGALVVWLIQRIFDRRRPVELPRTDASDIDEPPAE